jgi:hypothetical protein
MTPWDEMGSHSTRKDVEERHKESGIKESTASIQENQRTRI